MACPRLVARFETNAWMHFQPFGDLPDLSREEDELRKLWSAAQTRNALLERLAERG